MGSAKQILESEPAIGDELESKSPLDRIRWADKRYGDKLVLTTSFGIQSAVMLHLATQIRADIPIVFIDTGYLFPETYQFAEALRERLNLNLKVYHPLRSAAHQEALFGKRWEDGKEGLEAYNLENKVEPMNRALNELKASAWLSGLRRVQASTRKELKIVEQQNKTVKIHPIVDLTEKDIYYYLKQYDLPYHPLFDQGYVSVGDWHSSAPLSEGMSAEDTRFGGIKRECGLHELSGNSDWQI